MRLRIKFEDIAQLAGDVEQYLANGGKIQQIPSGATGREFCHIPKTQKMLAEMPRRCKRCDRRFVLQNEMQVYCGKACRDAAEYQRRKERADA